MKTKKSTKDQYKVFCLKQTGYSWCLYVTRVKENGFSKLGNLMTYIHIFQGYNIVRDFNSMYNLDTIYKHA